MSEIAGNLPRTFMSFRNLERGTQLHEEERTERDLREQNVSPNVCPERVEVPETDTSPVKTLAILQRACTSQRTVRKSAVDMSELPSRSDDGLSVSEFCAEEARSFSEAEMSKLVDLGGESVAEMSSEGGLRVQIDTGETATEEILFG